jgi:hypothetical protein
VGHDERWLKQVGGGVTFLTRGCVFLAGREHDDSGGGDGGDPHGDSGG